MNLVWPSSSYISMLLRRFKIPLWCFSLSKSCFYGTGLSLKLTFFSLPPPKHTHTQLDSKRKYVKEKEKMLILSSLKRFPGPWVGVDMRRKLLQHSKRLNFRLQMAGEPAKGTSQIWVILSQISAQLLAPFHTNWSCCVAISSLFWIDIKLPLDYNAWEWML